MRISTCQQFFMIHKTDTKVEIMLSSLRVTQWRMTLNYLLQLHYFYLRVTYIERKQSGHIVENEKF